MAPIGGTDMRTIGTEEHFVTDEVVTAWSRLDSRAREDRSGLSGGEAGAGNVRLGGEDRGCETLIPPLRRFTLKVMGRSSIRTVDVRADAAGLCTRPGTRADCLRACRRRRHASKPYGS
jgi:hypothetical protein